MATEINSLQRSVPIVEDNNTPTSFFQTIWDSIKAALNEVVASVAALTVTVSALTTTVNGKANKGNNTDITTLKGLIDGTQGSPSLAFSSDTSIGLFRPFAQGIGLAANNYSLLILDSQNITTSDVRIGGNSGGGSGGQSNVFVGGRAGESWGSGDANVIIGNNAALAVSSSVGGCVIIGSDAVNGVSSVSSATIVGYGAGQSLTGSGNSFFGRAAGQVATSGTDNTFIGYFSAFNATSGNNNICIGAGSSKAAATTSNSITLGDSAITVLRCQVTTITALSDERDKKDIKDLDKGLDFILALRPVSFVWNMRDGKQIGVPDTGFIAQEVDAVQKLYGEIPGLVYKENADKLELGQGKLIPFLVLAIQQQQEQIDDLRYQITKYITSINNSNI